MATTANSQRIIEVENLQAEIDTLLAPHAASRRPGQRERLSAILTALKFVKAGNSVSPEVRVDIVATCLARYANDIVGKRCPLLESKIRLSEPASKLYRHWIAHSRIADLASPDVAPRSRPTSYGER